MSLKLKLDFLESQNGSVKDKKAYDFNTEVGTYSGEIKDGNMHGQGKMKYANGEYFEGSFLDNERSGEGRIFWPNGDVYDGEWEDDKMNGTGRMTYSNGDVYIGDWICDLMFDGKMIYTNGDVYEGGWSRGKKYFNGKMTFANGDFFEGEWKNDCIIGGTWSEGKSNDIYNARITYNEDDKTNFYIKKGYVYEGQMKDNKFFGQGVLRNTEKEIVAEGLWQNNECISLQIIKLSQAKEYKQILTIYEELAVNDAFSENRKFFEEEIDKYNLLLISELTNSFSGNLTNDSIPQKQSKESNDDFDDFA